MSALLFSKGKITQIGIIILFTLQIAYSIPYMNINHHMISGNRSSHEFPFLNNSMIINVLDTQYKNESFIKYYLFIISICMYGKTNSNYNYNLCQLGGGRLG